VSAGEFIVGCMRTTTAALQRADLSKLAAKYRIPLAWARFYLNQELNRSNRGR
jgi:hypothetical protein